MLVMCPFWFSANTSHNYQNSSGNYGGFAGGAAGGTYNSMRTIDFTSKAIGSTTHLPAYSYGFGATSTTYGMYMAGGTISGTTGASTQLFLWVPATYTSGTNISSSKAAVAGCGNTTLGVFRGGSDSASAPTTYYATSDVYTYNTDAVTSGVNLAVARGGMGATGNSTTAIFVGGSTATTTCVTTIDTYTYASNTNANGTSLATRSTGIVAAGTSTVGILASGGSNTVPVATTTKYTFSNGSMASGTSLSQGHQFGGGTGNATVGVFASGEYNNSPTLNTAISVYGNKSNYANTTNAFNTYTYSNDTQVVSSTYFTDGGMFMAAGSTSPGSY